MRAIFPIAVSVTFKLHTATVTSQKIKSFPIWAAAINLPPVPAAFVRTKFFWLAL
jgi:hypothetical protein